MITQNLAVGWFPSAAPAKPPVDGHALVVNATANYDNGELLARTGGSHLSAFRSVQNVPVYLVAVGPAMTRLAGEAADGLLVHGFTSSHHMAGRTTANGAEGSWLT